jgi:hypothetical protein
MRTNPQKKCVIYPMGCDGLDLEEIMEPFPCSINAFPCKHLALPLRIRKLWRVDIQMFIDKVAANLPA